jgi:hypothetical protein
VTNKRQPGELPEGHIEYTIVPGDTIWQIAQSNGLSLPELTSANPHLEKDPARPGGDPWHWIYPGEIVHIPPPHGGRDRGGAEPSGVQAAVRPVEGEVTVSFPASDIRKIELAARLYDVSAADFVRSAALARVDELAGNEAFRNGVAALIASDREILDDWRAAAATPTGH